jgi:hypothetical protein
MPLRRLKLRVRPSTIAAAILWVGFGAAKLAEPADGLFFRQRLSRSSMMTVGAFEIAVGVAVLSARRIGSLGATAGTAMAVLFAIDGLLNGKSGCGCTGRIPIEPAMLAILNAILLAAHAADWRGRTQGSSDVSAVRPVGTGE